MCEVRAIVLVDRKTQAALEGTDVVLEEVGVFVEVDGLEGEFPEALSSVGVGARVGRYTSAAELTTGTILK